MKTLLFSGVFFLLIYVCMSSTCNTEFCTLDDLKEAYKKKVCKKEPLTQKNVELYNGNVLRMKYHTLLYRNFLFCSNDNALLYDMNIENYRSKQLDGGGRASTKYILNYFYRTLHVVAKFKEIGTTKTVCTIENMYSKVMFDGDNYDQHNRNVVNNSSLFVNINLTNIVNLNNITDNKHYELVDNILMDPSFDKNMIGNLFNSGADAMEYGITTNIIFNDFFNYVINYPDTFGSWLNQTIFDFGNLDEEIEYNNHADSFINDTLNSYFDDLFNILANNTDLKIKHVYEFMDSIFVNRSIGFGVDLTGGSTFHVLNYVNDYKDKPIETQEVYSSVLKIALNIDKIDVLNSSGTNFTYIKDQLTNQSAIIERKKELSYRIIKKIIKSVTGKDYDKDSVIVEKNDKPNVLNRLKKYFFIHFFEKMGDSDTLQERIENEIERTMEETIISLMVSSMYEIKTPITFSLPNGEMNSIKTAIVLGLAKVCSKCYSDEGYKYLNLNFQERSFANVTKSDLKNFLEFTDVCKVNQCSKDLFSTLIYEQNWYVSGGINTLLLTFVNKLISDENYNVMLPDKGLTVTNLNATFKSLIPIDNVTSPQGQKYDAYLKGVGEYTSSSFGIIWGLLTLSIGQHQSRYECARDCSFIHPTLPVDCKLLSKKCENDTNKVFSIGSRDDTFDIDIKHSLRLGS